MVNKPTATTPLLVLVAALTISGCDSAGTTAMQLGSGHFLVVHPISGDFAVYQVVDGSYRKLVSLNNAENKELSCSSELEESNRTSVAASAQWIAGQVFWHLTVSGSDPYKQRRVEPGKWTDWVLGRGMSVERTVWINILGGAGDKYTLANIEVPISGSVRNIGKAEVRQSGTRQMDPDLYAAAGACWITWSGFDPYPESGLSEEIQEGDFSIPIKPPSSVESKTKS